jgi:hypothetical protein
MKFLHKSFRAKAKDKIEIEFDRPTRVLLLESRLFRRYRKGIEVEQIGGYEKNSPVIHEVPYDGIWHAIIEKGSYRNPLNVSGDARLIPHRYDTLNGEEQVETRQKAEQDYDDTLD